MPLQNLEFKAGLNREGTDYSNKGGWYSGDKIRFRSGQPEKIGGWTQVSTSQFIGYARSIWNWEALSGALYLGLGTESKYYIFYFLRWHVQRHYANLLPSSRQHRYVI